MTNITHLKNCSLAIPSTINTLPAFTKTTATSATNCSLIQENAMLASEQTREHKAFI